VPIIKSAGVLHLVSELKAARGCRVLCRDRVAEELERRRGTPIAEHLKLVLTIIDRQVH
jgi:hypothetical protein